MVIRNLFDPSRDIYRTIEKVITYGADQEQRLKAEISEYVVTDSIEDQIERLLSKMQAAMDAGGDNEVGVWVSGFYGSGKSSFTKYLGLAFDDHISVDGQPFLTHLRDRLHRTTTKALLGTVAKRFPAAVLLLDLASEQIAGATLEVVSTVLYYKVLQWAGYSRNLKVAAFERKLKKDGRYEEFGKLFEETVGQLWSDYQNDELVVDSLLPGLANKMYPELFKTDQSFNTASSDVIVLLDDRIKEIIDIVREATGKEYIIFIVDEIGQYVGSNQNKILDLQGLAQNLKNIGDGKVWLVGTAQQTLTEDDPRAALNSPELYKLKDRFPIQIELESSDIREICYRRLLGKSPEGEKQLGKLFDDHGQALRHNTKLEDAKFYDAEFDREAFVNLYPFLPAHFDILLHLLGALARSTGGIGLRSAIKVIQDILIEGADGKDPVADRKVGWLATTVTLYEALEKDIQRGFASIYQAVEKAGLRSFDSTLHHDIAKTIAVLQILGNLPVTRKNVASLMHPGVQDSSRAEALNKAIEELLSDSLVPLGEKDNILQFFSEKLNDIEQERAKILLPTVERRRLSNEALREVFHQLPSARLHGSHTVTSGLKAQSGAQAFGLAGERETIQTLVEFVDPTDYETARARLVDESRHKSSEHVIYLLGRTAPETDELVAAIYQSLRIVELHRNEPDQEVREYCAGQTDRAGRLLLDLQQLLRRSLAKGSFIFRGQTTAVDSLDQDLLAASKAHLAEAAEQVFDRYPEAPVRADTALAEKFLRTNNLSAITSQLDPLSLVQISAGTPSINTEHKALVSVRDYIDRNGTVDGKRLLENFAGAPFGWSQDTLRYLIAAMLVAGEVKLKVSGREVTVNGQQAIDALKTNNSFKPVGVALRDDRPSTEIVARAAERLTDLIGETILPLEDEISKAAAKNLPQLQHQFAPLSERLETLNLPGAERIRLMNQEIADLLFTDASDAPQRFGGEESALYDSLKWAQSVQRALAQGLGETVKTLRQHRNAITGLPSLGIPGELRSDLAEELTSLDERLAQEDFFKHDADLNTALTRLKSRISSAVKEMAGAQAQLLKESEEDLKRVPEWLEITREDQENALSQLQGLTAETGDDLAGLMQLINFELDIHAQLGELKRKIVEEGRERRRQRIEAQKAKGGLQEKHRQAVAIPETLHSMAELEDLIRRLETLREELALYAEFDLDITRE